MGYILATGSTDGHVFVMDARITNEFNVIGYTSK